MLTLSTPGFYTTIQDLGRFCYRAQGVPVSGAMDEMALKTGNQLLENPADAAGLEITMQGPDLIFEAPTYFTITGAIFNVHLNNQKIKNWRVYKAAKGDHLSFGKLKKGIRSYLIVKNGFDIPKILNSYSFYQPITSPSRLEKGDQIPYHPSTDFSPFIKKTIPYNYLEEDALEVTKGPEFHLLNAKQVEALKSKQFTITMENSRMGYRLKEEIGNLDYSMLTSATLPGTVQCTPAGQLIVLMKDGPVTGGYPRILQLTKRSIAVLAQKRFGDVVSFVLKTSV